MKTKIILILALFLSNNLHSQEGIDYYFGLGVEKNYEKAFTAFLNDNTSEYIPYIILMYLNGDGVNVNPKEALAVWEKAASTNGYDDPKMEYLKEIIDERLANPDGTFLRVDYCDIAMTTIDINFCGDIQNHLRDQEMQSMISQITSDFNSSQKELFDLIQNNYSIIRKNDADRMYNLYFDGTIRGAAYSGMEFYIQDKHQKRIELLLVKNSINNFTESDFIKADKSLNEAYKKQKLKNQNHFEETIQIYKDDPEKIKYYKNLISEVNLNLKNAQLAWINYRDNWVKLLKKITGNDNIEISLKTFLTIERTEELNFDSVGINPD